MPTPALEPWSLFGGCTPRAEAAWFRKTGDLEPTAGFIQRACVDINTPVFSVTYDLAGLQPIVGYTVLNRVPAPQAGPSDPSETDNQQLSLSGSTLTLENGGSVELPIALPGPTAWDNAVW